MKKFLEYISKEENDSKIIVSNLKEIYNNMLKANSKEKNYIDISSFLYHFGIIHQTYTGYIQHDAQEFFRLLLNDLNKDLNEVKKLQEYKEIIYTDPKDKKLCEKEFYNFSRNIEKSIITDIFYNEIMTKYTCICSNIFYRFQNIFDFPLLIPDEKNVFDLKNLIKLYFESEIVEFESKCIKCKEVVKHNKEIIIARPSTLLIFSLQRINNINRTKNNCFVKIPNTLDMTEFIDSEIGFNKNRQYNLYGIVNHLGTIDFGHYTCFLKSYKNNLWYKFDDKNVNIIDGNLLDLKNAYIIIYSLNKN